jgi:RNA polymerase sigma-70 factor (ECF subfamily)
MDMTVQLNPIAPTDLLTDAEIVARILAGDAALFEILMRRYNQRIYRAVVAVLGSDEEAEDVMQEAYLRAYEHLHQFAGRAQFSTWLTRIAVNAAIARRRSSRRIWQGEDETMIAMVETDSPDPEEQTLTSELRAVLERELGRLQTDYRTVLMMRDIEGLSTAETAAALDISEDLVKTRLHRARTMLRDRLFKRAGVTYESLFTFGSSRCDRVVAEVMARIAARR